MFVASSFTEAEWTRELSVKEASAGDPSYTILVS